MNKFIGLVILLFLCLGVERAAAVEVWGTCTCVGKGDTQVFGELTTKKCEEKKQDLLGQDAEKNWLCTWKPEPKGICDCRHEGMPVTNPPTDDPTFRYLKTKAGCSEYEISETSKMPSPEQMRCIWTEQKKDGCYCTAQGTDGRDMSEFALRLDALTNSECKDAIVENDPAYDGATISYSECLFVSNSASFEAGAVPGTAGNENTSGSAGGATMGGTTIGAGVGFVNNAQALAAYRGVGFINDGKTVQLQNPLPTTKIPELIGTIIKTALGVMGSFAFLAFVYGGFLWLVAAGNDEKIKKGKDSMVWATIGIFVIFSAYGLMGLFFRTIGAWQGDVSDGGVVRSDALIREAGCYCRKMTGGTREKMQIEKSKCLPNKVINHSDNTKLFKTVEDCQWMEAGSTANAVPFIGEGE